MQLPVPQSPAPANRARTGAPFRVCVDDHLDESESERVQETFRDENAKEVQAIFRDESAKKVQAIFHDESDCGCVHVLNDHDGKNGNGDCALEPQILCVHILLVSIVPEH